MPSNRHELRQKAPKKLVVYPERIGTLLVEDETSGLFSINQQKLTTQRIVTIYILKDTLEARLWAQIYGRLIIRHLQNERQFHPWTYQAPKIYFYTPLTPASDGCEYTQEEQALDRCEALLISQDRSRCEQVIGQYQFAGLIILSDSQLCQVLASHRRVFLMLLGDRRYLHILNFIIETLDLRELFRAWMPNKYGITQLKEILYKAAKVGCMPLVHSLVDILDHEINSVDPLGATPLYMAAQEGHEDIVRFLLSHKADANLGSKEGVPPLHIATQLNHFNIVRILLSGGANINALTPDNVTPLYIAAQEGHLDLVKLLIHSGATLHLAARGLTPLHIASVKNHKKIIGCLILAGARVDDSTGTGIFPIHLAAIMGHAKTVAYLLAKGSSVNAKSVDDLTPLYCAAESGHVEVVKVLLKRQEVNLEIPNVKTQLTPVLAAAFNLHKEVVYLLVNAGAYVLRPAFNCENMLVFAVINNNLRLVELLLGVIFVRDVKSKALTLANQLGFKLIAQAIDKHLVMEALKNSMAQISLSTLEADYRHLGYLAALERTNHSSEPVVIMKNYYVHLMNKILPFYRNLSQTNDDKAPQFFKSRFTPCEIANAIDVLIQQQPLNDELHRVFQQEPVLHKAWKIIQLITPMLPPAPQSSLEPIAP